MQLLQELFELGRDPLVFPVFGLLVGLLLVFGFFQVARDPHAQTLNHRAVQRAYDVTEQFHVQRPVDVEVLEAWGRFTILNSVSSEPQ
jgi:hypothetical protein